MRNAVIGFTLCLITGIGLGCSGRNTDDVEGFLAKSGAASSRNSPDFVTLAKKLQPIVVNVSTTQMAAGPAPGGGPIRKKIPPKSSWSGFLVNGPHRADRSSNGISARVLLLDPTVPLLRMPT